MKVLEKKETEETPSAEDKRKHLDLIQHIVSRMGGNLFYLRGWSITLTAGLLALLSREKSPKESPLIIVAIIAVMFWLYDAYFLSMERKYRDLYNKVRKQPFRKVDYSMDVSEFANIKKNSLFSCMFSKTIAPFYVFLLSVSIYLIFKGS